MEEEADGSPDGTIDVARDPSGFREQTEVFSRHADAERRHLRNTDLRADITLKRIYFSVARKITRRWIQFIMAIVAAQFVARCFNRGLETPEFIAVITTTTATLVGFWVIVGAYLFPRRKD